MHLNHPETIPSYPCCMERLSSMKPVPGAKKAGTATVVFRSQKLYKQVSWYCQQKLSQLLMSIWTGPSASILGLCSSEPVPGFEAPVQHYDLGVPQLGDLG